MPNGHYQLKSIIWLSPGNPERRTGGFIYNRRLISALSVLNINVDLRILEAQWPWPEVQDLAPLSQIPQGSIVIADSLIWPGLDAQARTQLCTHTEVWVLVHSLIDEESPEESRQEAHARVLSALSEAHGWIATSERTADQLHDLFPDRIRCPVIIPATEMNEAQVHQRQVHQKTRNNQNQKTWQLINVAQVNPRKDQLSLLHALKDLQHLHWTLSFIGECDHESVYVQQLKTLIESHGMFDRIQWCGSLDEPELLHKYTTADLLIHTARSEAYGMVLSEALSMGLAVVSTPAGAIDSLNSPLLARIPVNSPQLVKSTLESILTGQHPLKGTPLLFPTWQDQAKLFIQLILSTNDTVSTHE